MDSSAASNPNRKRVLVVDDHLDGADLLGDALRLLGHETFVAHDAAVALSLAARFAPDVALLDLGMPHMSGFELAERLRSLVRGRLVMVAITGYTHENARERARAAGFEHYLVKPIDLTRLAALLTQGDAVAFGRGDSWLQD